MVVKGLQRFAEKARIFRRAIASSSARGILPISYAALTPSSGQLAWDLVFFLDDNLKRSIVLASNINLRVSSMVRPHRRAK